MHQDGFCHQKVTGLPGFSCTYTTTNEESASLEADSSLWILHLTLVQEQKHFR